jgi:Gliding motility associated protein GldN
MKRNKKKLLILIILLDCFFAFAQQRTVLLDYRRTKCVYNLTDGRLNGDYVSYHYNGNKKSEGRLENGYRAGRWIVWDSTGRKRMERVYKNPFEYTRILPAVSNEGPIPLLMENKYKLEYDSNGIVKYALLKAENAVWRHKFWRYLEPANNEILFENNRFLKLIIDLSISAKIEAFDTVDDRFTQVIKNELVKKMVGYTRIELVAIEIKEESIFDMERLVSEYRILGICPVIKIDNKIQKLFWVYYPDIRKYLGKELIQQKVKSPNIKTLDDLFIFRKFSSAIIKSTVDNPYDKFIKDYPAITPKGILEEQEALELTIIEVENNIWIGLTK